MKNVCKYNKKCKTLLVKKRKEQEINFRETERTFMDKINEYEKFDLYSFYREKTVLTKTFFVCFFKCNYQNQ